MHYFWRWNFQRDIYHVGALSVETLRPVKAQGRHGGWDRLGAQQHASQQHIAGETLTLVAQTWINRYCTIDEKDTNEIMQASEFCEPITSQHSARGSNQRLFPVAISLSWLPSSIPCRIVSQCQSWLSLPRPKRSSSSLIGLCHIDQRLS